jgi:hypothetical protein
MYDEALLINITRNRTKQRWANKRNKIVLTH